MLGGFELACLNLSRGLRNAGHEVLILTSPTDIAPSDDESWVDRSLNLRELFGVVGPRESDLGKFQIHESRVSNQANSLIVLDRIVKFAPDHVLMFNLVGIGGLAIMDTVNLTGVPWTMNLGDNVPGELLLGTHTEALEVYSPPGADIFAAGRYSVVSQTLIDEVASTGISLGQAEIIPRGVLYPDVERTRRHNDGGITRFVAAGILSPHKGVDIMIDAAADLVRSGIVNFRLELYGGGLTDHYTTVITERGLAGHVFVMGRVSQEALFAVHAHSDAFLFPTWEREPGASAPFEAASAGCIPIMTANCGPAERMVHGIHALKIERNADSLAHEMRRVIAGEVDLERMADAGRRLAHGDLSFALSVERLGNLIESATPPATRKINFNQLASEIIRKDIIAMGALYRTFSAELSRTPDPERDRMTEHDTAKATAERTKATSAWTELRSLPGRALRRALRPLVQDELLSQRTVINQQANLNHERQQRLDEREKSLDKHELEIRSLIEGMKKDLLATNHRVDDIESQSQNLRR